MENEGEMPRVYLRGFSHPSPIQDSLHKRNDSQSSIFNFLSKNANSINVEAEKKPHSQSQDSPGAKVIVRSPFLKKEKLAESTKVKEVETKDTVPVEPSNKEEEETVTNKKDTPLSKTRPTPLQSLRGKTPLSGMETMDSNMDIGEDNCSSSQKMNLIPKKAKDIVTTIIDESVVVDPRLQKKIEKIVEDKVKQKVEEIVEQMVDKKVETLMTDHNPALQSIGSIGENSDGPRSPMKRPLVLQKKTVDKVEKMRYTEESVGSNNSMQTSLRDKSQKGTTRTNFWEMDQKHSKNRHPPAERSPSKNRASAASNLSGIVGSRKPSLPPLNQSRGPSRGNSVIHMDQNQTFESIPTKQDYSFLSYSNLEETDVRFVLNQFTEFSKVNKILEDNLKRHQGYKKSKKDKSVSIPKLYDVYLPNQNHNLNNVITVKPITKTLPDYPPPPRSYSNSSPYLSEIKYKLKKPPVPRVHPRGYMAPILRSKIRSQVDTYEGNSGDENSRQSSMFIDNTNQSRRVSTQNATDIYQKYYAQQRAQTIQHDSTTKILMKPTPPAPRTSNLLNKASQKRIPNSKIHSTSLLGERSNSNRSLHKKPSRSVITEVSDTEIGSNRAKRKGSGLSARSSQRNLTRSRSSSRDFLDNNQLLREQYRIKPHLDRKDSETSLRGDSQMMSIHNEKSFMSKQESPEKSRLGEERDSYSRMSTIDKQAYTFSKTKRPFIGKEIEYTFSDFGIVSSLT